MNNPASTTSMLYLEAMCGIVAMFSPSAMRNELQTLSVMMLVVLLLGCGQQQKQKNDSALIGAWKSKIQFENGSLAPIKDLQFLYTFNSGGTMIESSNYDAAPPVPPGYGIWRATGHNQYEVKYEFFLTRPASPTEAASASGGWLPAGHGVLVESLSVSEDGNSFTSKIRYDMFDQAGRPIPGGGTAMARAVRLTFK
jgi:hypothetical protein